METNQFENFRLKNLEKIRGGYTIYCKNALGVNIGTVEHDCLNGVSGLTACMAVYTQAAQAAGPC